MRPLGPSSDSPRSVCKAGGRPLHPMSPTGPLGALACISSTNCGHGNEWRGTRPRGTMHKGCGPDDRWLARWRVQRGWTAKVVSQVPAHGWRGCSIPATLWQRHGNARQGRFTGAMEPDQGRDVILRELCTVVPKTGQPSTGVQRNPPAKRDEWRPLKLCIALGGEWVTSGIWLTH